MQIKKLILGTAAVLVVLTSVSARADTDPTPDASTYSDTARQPDWSFFCGIVDCS